MTIYKWDQKTMSVSVPEMDAEHQILIDKINKTYEAGQTKSPKNAILQAYKELIAYTEEHFADEEYYMEKIQYKGRIRHKAVHQELLKQMKTYLEYIEKTGVFTTAFWEFLTHWWKAHIQTMDMPYGKECKTKATPPIEKPNESV